MKSALYLLGLIAVTQAAGSSSTTSSTTTQCYMLNNKQWKGTQPYQYYDTECGKPTAAECIPCTPAPYEKPIPTWKKINDIYPKNPLWIENYASGTYYTKYAFTQDQYSKASQYSGAIDYIQWCQNSLYGVRINYRLKDFCNGTVTEPSVTVGNYQGLFNPAEDCAELSLTNQGECITNGAFYRHDKTGADYGIFGLWGYTSYNNTITIGLSQRAANNMGYGEWYITPRNQATAADIDGLKPWYSEKPFTLPKPDKRNQTCLTGLDLTTYTYSASWLYLTNVALWYNDSIRCGADLGLSGAVVSIAVGMAAIGFM